MTANDNRYDRLRLLSRQFDKQKDFAKAADLDPSHLSQMLNQTRGIGDRTARKIERALGLRRGEMDLPVRETGTILRGNQVPTSSTVSHVPLVSWAQLGLWTESVDMREPGYTETWEPVAGQVGPKAFAVPVEGDSMEPEFPAGGTIIVDPDVPVRSGDFVVARVNGSPTFRQLVQDAGSAYLKPLNTRYRIVEVDDTVETLGVVISQNKRYR